MTEFASPPATRIEIISAAIALCGKQQTVNTIDAGGPLATDAQKLYDSLVSAEFGSNRWRFTQDFQQIGILNTLAPSFDGWLYYWELPADVRMVLYVTPSVDYIVFGDKILTKTNQSLSLVYTKDVPVSKWPGAFSMYITYHLATMIGISVTNSDRLLARLNKGMELWQSRALFADGQSSRTTAFRFNPYVDVRYQDRNRT